MKLRTIAVAALALAPATAACQMWWPAWSEVTGVRVRQTIADRMPARILHVGGDLLLVLPYRVTPGLSRIVVESPRHDGLPGSVKTFELRLEPCVRYYINAQFDGPEGQGWGPVVDAMEVIPGCPLPGV